MSLVDALKDELLVSLVQSQLQSKVDEKTNHKEMSLLAFLSTSRVGLHVQVLKWRFLSICLKIKNDCAPGHGFSHRIIHLRFKHKVHVVILTLNFMFVVRVNCICRKYKC